MKPVILPIRTNRGLNEIGKPLKCLFWLHKWNRGIGHLYNSHIPPSIAIYDECERCGDTKNLMVADIDRVAIRKSSVLRFLARSGGWRFLDGDWRIK